MSRNREKPCKIYILGAHAQVPAWVFSATPDRIARYIGAYFAGGVIEGQETAMPNPPGPRIYFVGSHSSGKTTLARWVANRYGLPLITEVARSVLAETETTLDAMRVDVERTSDYQRRVFARQLAAEAAQSGGFVSDRAFDNLAYAAEHATVLGTLMTSAGAVEYMRQVAHGVVLFVRPHKELLKADGVRTGLDWDSVVRIDGMIKLLLEQFEIPHLSIGTPSMQERVRSVEFVMRLLGVQPAVQQAPLCSREAK